MKINAKNIDYLIDKCRRLENITKKYMLEIEEKNERIKELEDFPSTNHFDAAQTYQKELVKAEKRIKELESDGALIELKNVNKLAHERITDLENDLSEAQEQLAHSYDSGLEAVHPEDI